MFILSIITLSLEMISIILFVCFALGGDKIMQFVTLLYTSPILVLCIISLIGGIVMIRRRNNLKQAIATTIIGGVTLNIFVIMIILEIFVFATDRLPTPSLFGF